MLGPGGTIGILGGGQLGRMLAMSAAQLGLRCHIYTPERDSVASEISAETTVAPFTDGAALARFADACDAVTFEWENVPTAPLQFLGERIAPNLRALEVAQDRLREKRFVEDLGGQPAPFAPVSSAEEFARAVDRIGAPGILKTARDGYDGKGQWRIDSVRDADAVRLPQAPCVYEGFVTFTAEFSVILVRSAAGEVRFWDSTENRHVGGILSQSVWPPSDAVAPQVEPARALARKVADALGYVGVLTLEFFATATGPVFNEMAPRVHNSGHWTIEGAATSQFENHIRAVAGLPLGDTATIAARIEMDNLIGDVSRACDLLADPAAHLHLYGKAEAREGRKMGHVTRTWHA